MSTLHTQTTHVLLPCFNIGALHTGLEEAKATIEFEKRENSGKAEKDACTYFDAGLEGVIDMIAFIHKACPSDGKPMFSQQPNAALIKRLSDQLHEALTDLKFEKNEHGGDECTFFDSSIDSVKNAIAFLVLLQHPHLM